MFGRGIGVGASQHGEGVAMAPIGDEHLGAVQHVLLAVLGCVEGEGLHIAASVRFSESKPAPHLATGHGRQESRFLLLGAEVRDDVGHDVMGANDSADTHPALGNLLENHGEGGVVQPHPSPFFGDSDAKEAHSLHLFDEIEGHDVLLVVFIGDGQNVASHEVAHHVDDLAARLFRGLSSHRSLLAQVTVTISGLFVNLVLGPLGFQRFAEAWAFCRLREATRYAG